MPISCDVLASYQTNQPRRVYPLALAKCSEVLLLSQTSYDVRQNPTVPVFRTNHKHDVHCWQVLNSMRSYRNVLWDCWEELSLQEQSFFQGR